ncbi:MAG: prepilin peptidase [Clostridiaceae bacterium]|nr:prepilin peptidase [Clostridiaceae bacterium]
MDFGLLVAYFLLYGFVFLFGAVFGDFANVIIYRVPRKLSFARGRSMCPACGHVIRPLDMFPILGWVFLRGKCRDCGAKISPRYPIVEAVGGILAVLCALRFGFTFALPVVFAFCLILLCIAFIDFDTMEIPNGLLLALLIPAALMFIYYPGVSWLAHLIGAFCVSLPFFLITLLIPDAFGGGDIKLLFVVGLALGWQVTLLAAFLALLFGAVFALSSLKRGTLAKQSHFAFGPAITLGAAIAALYGSSIIAVYLNLFL